MYKKKGKLYLNGNSLREERRVCTSSRASCQIKMSFEIVGLILKLKIQIMAERP